MMIAGLGFLRIVCLSICCACLAGAQQAEGADIAAGQKLYQESCTACHGENARGGRGSNLVSGPWRWGRSDDAILKNILQGIPGTEMPAFPMPQSDGESTVAYLRSLRVSAPDEKITGDALAVRDLFF